MAVNIHLSRIPEGNAFWLPRAAFLATADLRNGASSAIFVVAGDKAVSRTVVVSAIEGDQVEVLSGLDKNDRVILTPPAELKDGDIVIPNPSY